ncbi:hypothetical protein MD484_g2920, partial [Candolleomyces efflorescens]
MPLMASKPPFDTPDMEQSVYDSDPDANPTKAEGSDSISVKSLEPEGLGGDLGSSQATDYSRVEEPIVTRKELWSYYRQCSLSV